MVRVIVIVIIAALGWCFYTGKIDLSNFKENSIEKLKNEKTKMKKRSVPLFSITVRVTSL